MTPNIQYEDHRYFAAAQDGSLLAEILFPARSASVIEVTRTFVDPSLRGQGMADLLMQKVIAYAQSQGLRLLPSCEYAKRWMDKHPEHQALLYPADSQHRL
jgi:predicted GNAT family acetyltransferase